MCGCFSLAPYWGPSRQPRHVPRLGIQPAKLCFTGRASIHWATPARAEFISFQKIWTDKHSKLYLTQFLQQMFIKHLLCAKHWWTRQIRSTLEGPHSHDILMTISSGFHRPDSCMFSIPVTLYTGQLNPT